MKVRSQNSVKSGKFFKISLVLCSIAFLSLLFSFNQKPPNCTNCHRRKIIAVESSQSQPPTNVSHLLFGIAGSTKTWKKRQSYCELWWMPNVTRGFVWVDEKPNATWPATSPPYRVSADTSEFSYTCWYGSRGSQYGLLAAHPVAPLVSLHHVDYLPPIFPTMIQIDALKALKTAYNLDPGRTLQQSFCYHPARNWSISVSWGYTVQLYPWLATPKDMEKSFQTFETWKSWSDGPFTFNTRPVQSDPCQMPILFFLDLAESPNRTVTSYKRQLDVWEKECSRDEFQLAQKVERFRVVTFGPFSASHWIKAPRRQCCQVVNGTSMDNVVNVWMRGCNPFETNSLKAFKFMVFRPADVFALFVRTFLVISIVASFSLFFYLTLYDKIPRCHGCYGALRISNHREVKAFGAGEQPTNISHLVFGIGGSVKTWDERRHYCELWWNKNITRGFVWLEEKPEFPWPQSSPPYRISDDTSQFNYTCCEIGVPLTKELGFHQVDIRGNIYGILAAHPVAPLVSLHHLDYLEAIFPAMTRPDSIKKLHTAYKTDPGRALQHSFCYDMARNWSVSVSWGYSVQLYPWLATAKELDTPFLTFQTWKTEANESFTFDTRPVSSNPCERPILYFLDTAERFGGRRWRTLTRYRKYVENNTNECKQPDYASAVSVEYFNVSAPEFDRRLWRQAPRRQCCDVVHDNNTINGLMQVRIRDCNQFESVTPP
ncbi:hypothetical protein SDJN02_19138, partial [Cucurbita argyrosperma subsp. argyrosperma]